MNDDQAKELLDIQRELLRLERDRREREIRNREAIAKAILQVRARYARELSFVRRGCWGCALYLLVPIAGGAGAGAIFALTRLIKRRP